MEWQCTRAIILPCIFIELSPHNPLTISFLMMDACPGHILESTKGIKLGTYTDVY